MSTNAEQEAYEVTDRGFVHWTPIKTTCGHEVKVYESSAATTPAHMWLAIEGEAHLEGEPKPHAGIPFGIAQGSIAAHLSYEQALRTHASIGAWLERHKAGFATARADAYASELAAELGVEWSPES
jgi:hypothetical protein